VLTGTQRFTLGPWRVDPQLDQLEGDGGIVKLEPRAMRLLLVLAQARGELVSTASLMSGVWAGVVVTQGSLYEAIAQLRKALGRNAAGDEPIATVPRRGYRLCWPVRALDALPLGPRSVAVLPFRARPLPADFDFVLDSLADGLIGELSRQPDLVVVARGTMLAFAGCERAPTEVCRQLGVRFVVDGALGVHRDELVVSLQVVDGLSGLAVGAEVLHVPLRDWPDAVRIVVGRLARSLQFEMRDTASNDRCTEAENDADLLAARTLATRAWVELFARPENPATNQRARQWAQAAQALDGTLALAAIGLATCDWRAAQFGWGPGTPADLRDRALQHASLAVELGPSDPDAHYVLALVAYSRGETARAEEALRHCLRLSASFAPAHGLLALVRTRRGHPEEAAGLCERAFLLSPREPLRAVWHLAKAWAALALGDAAQALEESQRGMAVNPHFPTCYVTGAAAAQQLGVRQHASAWVTLLRERTVFNSLRAVQEHLPVATEPAHQHQMRQVVELLRQAGLPAT
jgi:DNA-binding winged helix-turn-helix (wHTH) protein/TolB-like protein/Flp pilus assembly protein TadD